MSEQARILVVDDDPSVRHLLVELLKKAGYEVSTAVDGVEAEEIAAGTSPDLILLDLVMPRRDGLELCAILKRNEETAAIPVIFVTSSSRSDQIAQAFSAGASDYVTKPFRARELLARVSVHVRLRRAEKELRASEGRFRTVVKANKNAMVTIGEDRLITLFNPAAEAMFGRSAAEMLGQPVDCLIPEEYRERHRRAAEAYFTRGESSGVIGTTVELAALRADGSSFPVELSLAAGDHADHRFALASMADITSRRKAHEKLSRIQAALDDATDGVLIVERDGSVSYANAAFTELLRCTLDMINKDGWDSIFVTRAVAGKIREATTRLDKWTGETEMISKRGRAFPAEVRAAPIPDVAATSAGVVLFVNDITERRRAEADRLRQAAIERERNHLRDAVGALEGVLGVVGHELRTPLAGVRAMAEFLLREDARQTAEFESFLRSIHDQVVKMSSTVNDTLEIARMNSGTAQWNWSEVKVHEVCRQALETVRPLVDREKVRLGMSVTPADLRMKGDPGAVERLVVNLLSNSNQHTSEGSILIRAVGEEWENGRWVKIQVRDTGEGMRPQIASRLGVAFALNSGMVGDTHVTGSGLGLAICRGIVAAHGGTISVATAPGKGTTITVVLQADLPEPASVEDAADIVFEVKS